MRAYFFTNFYLSSIQQGIQPAHCMADMFIKYKNSEISCKEHETLYTWATYHKTMICLNGGTSVDLAELWKQIADIAQILNLPCGTFNEDEGLNEALTCVGIVVPEEIYELASDMRKQSKNTALDAMFGGSNILFNATVVNNSNPSHVALAEVLNNHSLAK